MSDPNLTSLAGGLIKGIVADTLMDNHSDAPDVFVNEALRRIFRVPGYDTLSGADVSLILAVADIAAQAVLALADARNENPAKTFAGLANS